MLSLLHREGGASTLMETELQDVGLAVYPRIKVLFQPTGRTNPHVSCQALDYFSDSPGKPVVLLKALEDGHKHRLKVARRERIKQGADLIVTGNLCNAKQGLGVIAAFGVLQPA